MATKSVTLGMATIGPQHWRNNTIKGIKLSQNIVQRSDKACEVGKSLDPLPHLRDTVAELSNNEAHRHFRETRAVVHQLRESLLDTNEEVKSLSRTKEAFEKALTNIRKDLKLNEDNKLTRTFRPTREKVHDGADDLLHAERMHLLNMKKILESQLLLYQQQLQILDKSRKRLSDVLQERSRVLDLVCHAMPSVSMSASAVTQRTGIFSYSARPSSVIGMSPQQEIDPLGAYTPEVDAALRDAKDARVRSVTLRKDALDIMDKCNKMQAAAHKSVNDGFTQKLAETVALKQQLQMASGETRHALNRAQRWYDSTEKAWGYSKGPLSSADLLAHERLERPIMKVFQRHPGTNMPEAQEIVKAGDGLLESLQATSRNIGLLRLTQLQLRDDIRDKSAAMDIDGSIARMRRRKADHRWAMGAAF